MGFAVLRASFAAAARGSVVRAGHYLQTTHAAYAAASTGASSLLPPAASAYNPQGVLHRFWMATQAGAAAAPAAAAAAAAAGLPAYVPQENKKWDPDSGTVAPFFQQLGFILDMQVSKPRQVPDLYNEFAAPDAQLTGVSLVDLFVPVEVPVKGKDFNFDYRPPTEGELSSLAYKQPSITLSDGSPPRQGAMEFKDSEITVRSLMMAEQIHAKCKEQPNPSDGPFGSGLTQTFQAPGSKGYFTVQELLDVIKDYELQRRPCTNWMGGIDVHHRFFAGLTKRQDGSWYLSWDS